MLNWDDYNESEKAPKPQQAKTEIEQPAPESIIEEEQVEENFTPVELGDRAHQAKDAIQSLDTKAGEEQQNKIHENVAKQLDQDKRLKKVERKKRSKRQ